MPGHAFTLGHTTRRLPLSDRARRTMRERIAVRCVLHAEVVSLHRTGETFSLTDAGYIDLVSGLEYIDAQFTADLQTIVRLTVARAQFP